jgi:23S rRNA (adenine1618-N6)-methyltransferase
MSSEKKQQEKTRLHPRNRNRERYDLKALIKAVPELKNHVKPNKYGDDSVDFSSPIAVKFLNKALLNHYYGIKNWDFPDENLCPPIPGRADYIHYAADLLGETNFGRIPTGKNITCIDIGVGASCIYPIIGVTEYDWNFIASDTNQKAIDSAKNIISSNSALTDKIDCRLQNNAKDIFYGIITREGKIDICICNPPFHSSAEDALKGTQRKVKNLTGKKTDTPQLNFSGINDELIYEGGESRFISAIIRESVRFYKNCFWFTTLVSKQSNLRGVYKALEKTKATQVKTIPMGTGNKSSRIVAWTFLTQTEQKEWRETRWNTKKSK